MKHYVRAIKLGNAVWYIRFWPPFRVWRAVFITNFRHAIEIKQKAMEWKKP